jgi:hypothetical protein
MNYTTNIYLIWELKINSREKSILIKEKGVYGKRLWRRLARCACVGVPRIKKGVYGVSPYKKKEASDNKGEGKAGGFFVGVFIFIFFLGFLF